MASQTKKAPRFTSTFSWEICSSVRGKLKPW